MILNPDDACALAFALKIKESKTGDLYRSGYDGAKEHHSPAGRSSAAQRG